MVAHPARSEGTIGRLVRSALGDGGRQGAHHGPVARAAFPRCAGRSAPARDRRGIGLAKDNLRLTTHADILHCDDLATTLAEAEGKRTCESVARVDVGPALRREA
jgi:hypothetical protein